MHSDAHLCIVTPAHAPGHESGQLSPAWIAHYTVDTHTENTSMILHILKRFVATSLLLIGLNACQADESRSGHNDAVTAIAAGALLIDVRTPEEFSAGSLPHAINIPHGSIVEGVRALGIDPHEEIVVFCRSGNRSGKALAALTDNGFDSVINGGSVRSLQAALTAAEVQP